MCIRDRGTHYAVIPIEESVSLTEKQLQSATIHDYGTGKDETLSVSSFALENIQARDRGARVIAGMASLWGGGFSCNSNKSEMTVGYATFYGDIAGVMALIGDLWKHQVYALGRYLNEQVYHKDVIPDEVFTIKPSAEPVSYTHLELTHYGNQDCMRTGGSAPRPSRDQSAPGPRNH